MLFRFGFPSIGGLDLAKKKRKEDVVLLGKFPGLLSRRKESLKKGKESLALICFLGWKEIRVVVSLGLLLLETELLADSWQDLVAQEKKGKFVWKQYVARFKERRDHP